MIKLILFSCLFTLSVSLLAQPGKVATKPKPVTKTANPRPVFKTLNDSASYVIGLSIAMFCKQQGITRLNTGLITKAVNDIYGNKPVLLNEMTCNGIINKLMTRGTPPANPVAKTTNPKLLLKTPTDSISYAIGSDRAGFFKQQGITTLNTALITWAVNDVLGNKPIPINDATANNVMNKLIMRMQEDKVRPAIEAGNAFLANNKNRPGVKTTASGLQYEVITEGTGIKPVAADTFVCHYRGTLINGTEFDASYNRGQPLIYPVTAVIRGWTEGLQLMPVGSKYKFYIPYTLAYGSFDNGAIPGGSALVFEVELLDVKKHQ